MPTIPTVYGKRVWRNQPSEFSEKVRLRGAIQGGRWAPRIQMVRSDHLDARRPSSALDCSSQSDLFGKFARLVAPYALAVHRWDCWHSNWPGAFRPGNEWRGNPRAGLPRD